MNGWSNLTLGDVLELKRGYDLPTAKREAGHVPIISSSGPSDFHSEAKIEGPGVITGRYGTIGQVFFTRDAFWPLNTALYVRDFKGNDPRFCYYFLKTLDWNKFNDKSGVPGVNRNDAHQEPVLLPPLAEQREIASILGALDNKIELNRQMAATLEEMARALYRSWFVDFEPVKAKTEGLAPAFMDEATAALFPDRFGDDGLPEGWRRGCLSDVAINPRTGVKPEQIDPSTPYIGLEHMPRRSIRLGDWGTAEDVGSQKSAMRRGDFLFGKLRPYFHKVGISPVDGICSTDIIVVRPKAPEWASFVLSVISSDDFVEHTNAGSSGTRMPRTNWKDMGRYEVVLPPVAVAAAFEAALSSMGDRIVAGVHEARTLAALRDTLLPKLMSGELRVGEAHHQIEEVA